MRSALPTAIGLLLLSACSPPPFERTEPPTPTSTGATRLAAAECQRLSRCDPDRFAHAWGDEATCERNLATEDFQVYFVDPNVRLPAGFVDTCVAALDAQKGDTCTTVYPSGCATLPGMTPIGGKCLTGLGCASGATCGFMAGPGEPIPSCGVCETGGIPPCGGCPEGQTCTATGCAAKSPVGGPCLGEINCQDGLACNSGTCKVRAKAGDPCDPMSNAVTSCEKALDCGQVSHTCRPHLYAGVDATCGTVGDDSINCDRSNCIIPFGSHTGTCLAMIRDGEACDPGGARCESDGRCIEGRCTAARVCW